MFLHADKAKADPSLCCMHVIVGFVVLWLTFTWMSCLERKRSITCRDSFIDCLISVHTVREHTMLFRLYTAILLRIMIQSLTHISLASHFWDIGKWCKPRSKSDLGLHCLLTGISIWNRIKIKKYTPKTGNGLIQLIRVDGSTRHMWVKGTIMILSFQTDRSEQKEAV